jgi:hypothetical protein
MPQAVLSPLSDSNSSAVADWLELAVLTEGRRRLSPGRAREMMAGSGSAVDEVDVALAFGVLRERAARKTPFYPFKFSTLGLEADTTADMGDYAFFLLLAVTSEGSVQLPDLQRAAMLFERVVAQAAGQIFGANSASIRFGHPPEPGRPTEFLQAVQWLSSQMRARSLPLIGPYRRNDGGLDVIAWLDFVDGRCVGPVAAIQVTLESDLRSKSLEIAGNDLSRWIAISPPVPMLAVPIDGLSDPDLFEELSTRVVVLDRWRLMSCLHPNRVGEEARLWAQNRIQELQL